jgi:YggT family protein
MSAGPTISLVARYTVAAAFFVSAFVALVYWAVRRGKLSAFGPLARATRSFADPFIKPLERRVIRWGGNPQDAPLWLLGIILVLGLIFLSLLNWLIGFVYEIFSLEHRGPGAWASFLLNLVYNVLLLALLVRVIGSWLGMGRYNRWLRFAYRLTDWIVEPIRRMLPPLGFIDLSPLVAFLALWLIRTMVARLFHI